MSVSTILLLIAVILFVLAGFSVNIPLLGHTVEFGLAFFAASFFPPRVS